MAARLVQREQKREQILRAALKVFARQGLYHFKVIEIAEKAGVGKGTIYEYFPSKEELMRGAIELILADYNAFTAQRVAGVNTPVDQVRSIITSSCEFFARPKWRLKLMFDLWSAGVPRERKQPHLFDARKWYTEMCESLSGIIDQGIKDGSFKQVDSKFAATVMIATLDGIMFQAALGLVSLTDPKVPDKLCRALLDGLI